jgi:ketosteroid isomerase-like protein
MQSGTERSEIEKALESMIGTLEDSDPRQRAYGYTEDVVFVMPGAPVVRGREEMLKRLESAAIMWSVTITPLTIEGTYNLAWADGLFTCMMDPTESNPGQRVAMRFLMVWRKESDGVWRIAREVLSADPSAK